MTPFTFESLESRRLFAAEGLPVQHAVLQPSGAQILAADQSELTIAQTQLQTDQTILAKDTTNDDAAVTAARLATVQHSVQRKKLKSDQAAASTLLASDQTALTASATNGLPTVIQDYAQINADGSSPTALTADNGKLSADQISLQTSVEAAAAKLKSDQASTQATIDADQAAVTQLINSLPAVSKQNNDLLNDNAALAADQAILPSAQTQFQNDELQYDLSSADTFFDEFVDINSGPTGDASYEYRSIQSQLTEDKAAQSADAAANSAAVAAARRNALKGSPLQSQLRADKADAPNIASNDQTALANSPQPDLAAVITAFERLAIDQANSSGTAIDQYQLASAQSRLRGDVIGAALKVQSDQTASQNQIASDKAAVQSLLNSNAAYSAAIAKQQSDATADALRVQADQSISDNLSNGNLSTTNSPFLNYNLT